MSVSTALMIVTAAVTKPICPRPSASASFCHMWFAAWPRCSREPCQPSEPQRRRPHDQTPGRSLVRVTGRHAPTCAPCRLPAPRAHARWRCPLLEGTTHTSPCGEDVCSVNITGAAAAGDLQPVIRSLSLMQSCSGTSRDAGSCACRSAAARSSRTACTGACHPAAGRPAYTMTNGCCS